MQALYPISLEIKNFCDSPAVTSIARYHDDYVAELEAVAAQLPACSDNCQIALNEAEYCTLKDMLGVQTRVWPAAADAFADASILLSLAKKANRSVPEYLHRQLTPAAQTVQDHLALQMAWLAGETPPEFSDAELAISLKEIRETGRALQALAWADLADDNALRHGNTLVQAENEISVLKEDIHLAMTRARVLDISEMEKLGQRLIDASGALASVTYSLEIFQDQRRPEDLHIEGNANDYGVENPAVIQQAIDCFNRLSIDISILPEFSRIVEEELAACRPVDTCPSETAALSDARLDSLASVLENEDKDKKLFYTLRKSICPM